MRLKNKVDSGISINWCMFHYCSGTQKLHESYIMYTYNLHNTRLHYYVWLIIHSKHQPITCSTSFCIINVRHKICVRLQKKNFFATVHVSVRKAGFSFAFQLIDTSDPNVAMSIFFTCFYLTNKNCGTVTATTQINKRTTITIINHRTHLYT